jgi:hypothetical protein
MTIDLPRFVIVLDEDHARAHNNGGYWMIVEVATGEILFRYESEITAAAELKLMIRLTKEGRMP